MNEIASGLHTAVIFCLSANHLSKEPKSAGRLPNCFFIATPQSLGRPVSRVERAPEVLSNEFNVCPATLSLLTLALAGRVALFFIRALSTCAQTEFGFCVGRRFRIFISHFISFLPFFLSSFLLVNLVKQTKDALRTSAHTFGRSKLGWFRIASWRCLTNAKNNAFAVLPLKSERRAMTQRTVGIKRAKSHLCVTQVQSKQTG